MRSQLIKVRRGARLQDGGERRERNEAGEYEGGERQVEALLAYWDPYIVIVLFDWYVAGGWTELFVV